MSVSFTFKGTTLPSGAVRRHPSGRASIVSAYGLALLLNGIDPNQKLDGYNGISDLLPRAPADEILPMVTDIGYPGGKLFGIGYKWRFRYSNSASGEVTGLSPIPTEGLSLGTYKFIGSADYLGQTAYFTLPGTSLSATFDTIELFRNLPQQDRVWYRVATASNPGAGNYVRITDNRADSEIVADGITSGLNPNPSYLEPIIPPVMHAHLHPSGRVFYYGIRRMGPYRAGTASLPADSHVVTGTNTRWTRAREGQRLRFEIDPDRTVYRIVEVTALGTMYVYPKAKTGASGAYEILDDRDGRTIWPSAPGKPNQHDPTEVFQVGIESSDTLMRLATLGRSTYALTRHRLIALVNDISEAPHLTVSQTEIAPEGCIGPWAACETPFGLVYVTEDLGVRVFDGSGLPRPLGGSSPLADFLPLTQFQGLDKGLLPDVYVYWDDVHRRLLVCGAPEGEVLGTWQLVYDPASGRWRGPWRRPLHVAGELANSDGSLTQVHGDYVGTIYEDDDQVQDIVSPVDDGVVVDFASNVLTVSGISLASAHLGVPILFDDGEGTYYLNWIYEVVSSTQLRLILTPDYTPAAGWTFQLGAIHWRLETAYVDGGEPAQPKKFDVLRLRFDRTGLPDSIVVEGAADGRGYLTEADGAGDITGQVHAKARIDIEGRCHTVRISGRALNGQPKITQAIMDLTIRSGQ